MASGDGIIVYDKDGKVLPSGPTKLKEPMSGNWLKDLIRQHPTGAKVAVESLEAMLAIAKKAPGYLKIGGLLVGELAEDYIDDIKKEDPDGGAKITPERVQAVEKTLPKVQDKPVVPPVLNDEQAKAIGALSDAFKTIEDVRKYHNARMGFAIENDSHAKTAAQLFDMLNGMHAVWDKKLGAARKADYCETALMLTLMKVLSNDEIMALVRKGMCQVITAEMFGKCGFGR